MPFITLLILVSVCAVAKDSPAGTGCATQASMPLEVCEDLCLWQLAAAVED